MLDSLTDLRPALAIAEQAARIVAPELRAGFGRIAPSGVKSSAAVDVVTQLDGETEERLAEQLRVFDPSIGFQGEESGKQGDPSRYWLVDPIDGTAHFIRGLPFCTTMIALVDKGQVVVGVIYDFVRDEMYSAALGHGAQCNAERIRVSDRRLDEAYLAIELKTSVGRNRDLFAAMEQSFMMVDTVSAGYEFAMVAAGRLDGRITKDPWGRDWDYAAGALLVREAGGLVENIGARSFDISNGDFLATNRPVNAALTTGPNCFFPVDG